MKFKIEKVANMVFITSDCDVVFYAWNVEDLTERKLNNAIKKIQNNLNDNAEFIRTF